MTAPGPASGRSSLASSPRGAVLCAGCVQPVAQTEPTCPRCEAEPLLDGRYVLLQVLGRGSAGTTFKGRAVPSGELVAIKEIPLRPADPPKRRELFQREASILRQLHHPAIPRYADHFEAGHGRGRAAFLAQEYIEGEDLAREMDRHRYSSIEVLDLIDELLGILAYLHALAPPVIHRDIKPANIIRRASDGRLVLVDFGSVRDALVDEAFGGHTVAGTFGYMAPEQFRGDASPGSDLYGVGALAVHLLTRRQPHTMLTPTGQLAWAAHTRVDPAVRVLLRSLLAPDPTLRPSSAMEVRKWLRKIRRTPHQVPLMPVPLGPIRGPTAPVTFRALAHPELHSLQPQPLDHLPMMSVVVGAATGLGLAAILLMMIFATLGVILL